MEYKQDANNFAQIFSNQFSDAGYVNRNILHSQDIKIDEDKTIKHQCSRQYLALLGLLYLCIW